MITPLTSPLLRDASSPTDKHDPPMRLFQEVPGQEQEGMASSYAFHPLGGQTGQAAHGDQCGNMASRFAHDLVNILTAIQGNTELAAFHLPEHSSLQRYLQNILSASSRGHELLEHLLSGMPHQKLFHKELNLHILVDEVLEVFQATLPSTITIEKIDRLQSTSMMGNPTQLFRMLSNLLSNAVRAMHGQEEGTLSIMLDKVLETDPLPFPTRTKAAYIKLMVRDTGSGMSPDLCGRIFHPYFTTHQDGKGLGLGLAIVKEVVTDHEGIVAVESEVGKGSLFTVYFPVSSGSGAQVSQLNSLAS